MDVQVCEMCGNVIGAKIYALSYGYISDEMLNENKNIRSIIEYNKYVNKYENIVKHIEICTNCVKCIETTINKRIKECRKLDKEYKNLLDYDCKNPMLKNPNNAKNKNHDEEIDGNK